ncbi:alpha-amylase family glycosyl hydrolase [Paracoccus aerius]
MLPYALHPTYGTPDDLRRFVDQAHSLGIMVILDLVMNHFGPEGAYLHHAAPPFFDEARHTPGVPPSTFPSLPFGNTGSNVPNTGSANTAWTGCGWTRSTRSAGRARKTS